MHFLSFRQNKPSEHAEKQDATPDCKNYPESMVRDEAPVTNPADSLLKSIKRFERVKLAATPNLGLLRGLPNVKYMAGMFLQESQWYVLKGSSSGILDAGMPSDSDVLLHSHPFYAKDTCGERAIPSPQDFLHSSQTAKNLLVSSFGITQYWHVEGLTRRSALVRGALSFPFGFLKEEGLPEYLLFLDGIGARHEFHSWDKINEQGLADILEPWHNHTDRPSADLVCRT